MIPGVDVVTRGAWQDPRYPVFGPPDNEANNDTVVIHYSGDGKSPASADVPAYLRAIQQSYTLNRGYSIGYSWAVDQAGNVYQLRGWEYQSAANRNHNDHTVPVLMLSGFDAASDAAVRSVRAIVAEAGRRAGRTMDITGHGQLDGAATACPGVALRAQITAGVFVPVPTPPPTEDDDMAYLAIPPTERAGKPWLYVSGSVRPATTFDVEDGVPQRKMDTIPARWRVQQYDDLYQAAGLS